MASAESETSSNFAAAALPPSDVVDLPDDYEGYDPASSELVDRDEFSNVYENADGTFTSEISIEPVNVPDGNEWIPASDEITHDSAGWDAEDHPLSPEFATHADDELTVSHGGSQVTFALEGADDSHIQRVPGTDSAVEYQDVLDGTDLRYDTKGAAVKETLVLDAAPSVTSWTWDISAPGLVFAKNELGDLEFTDADGVVQFHIPAPVVWDSSGETEVREPALASLTTSIVVNGDDYKLVLSADPAWLADSTRVYPVFVDPTLTAGDSSFHAYKSDGATRTDAVHVGNSRDSNTNKYWRSQAKYSYSSLAGKQVIDGSFKAAYVSGTANSYSGGVYVGTCYGYSGCYGDKLGTVTLGSGSTTVNDDRIAAQYAEWVDAGSYSHYLTSRGAETAGSYTYKQLNTSLSLTYKSFPSISGMDGDSPPSGSVSSLTPSLSVAAVDPTGSGVWVRYLVATSNTFTPGSLVLQSDWYTPGEVEVPSGTLDPDVTYYWKAQVKDSFDGLYGVTTVRDSATWSFSATNDPPPVPDGLRAVPGQTDGTQLLVGIDPTFETLSSDPDFDAASLEVEVDTDDGEGAPAVLLSSCVSQKAAPGRRVGCQIEGLTDGNTYHVRGRLNDGTEASAWGAWNAVKADGSLITPYSGSDEAYVPFDHAITLNDAISVMGARSETVLGYRFETDEVVGEWHLGEEDSPADVLADFYEDYGTAPEVTNVILEDPASGVALTGGLGMSRGSHLNALPESIISGKPEFDAPSVSTGDMTVVASEVVASAEDENVRVISPLALSSPTTTWGALAMASSPSVPSDFAWQPSSAFVKIQKYKTTSGSKKVKFLSGYYWNGTTHSPVNHPAGFGTEFSNDLYGTYYTGDPLRCRYYPTAEIPVEIPQCWGMGPMSDDDQSKCAYDSDVSRERLAASMHDWIWSVYLKKPLGGDPTKNAKSIGAYADNNDLWDKCNRNSITVGVRYPEKIPVSDDGQYKLYTSVRTFKGKTYSTTGSGNFIQAHVEATERVSCKDDEDQGKKVVLKLCMGRNVTIIWDGRGEYMSQALLQYRPDKTGNRRGPNYCWKVYKGDPDLGTSDRVVPVTTDCGGSW